MKNIILTSTLMILCLVGTAQQQGDSSAADTNQAPPAIEMKNDKPVGYNNDKNIFLLAEKYKSTKNINASQAELKDFNSWWTYTSQNINLSQKFNGLAPDSNEISKKLFLQLLTTGYFYPIKIGMKSNSPSYKLLFLDSSIKDIQNTIIQLASHQLFYYNMEGKELPNYQFEDIAGHKYNNVNTKGKFIVLKCWFIRCVACVKEFPELNKLVDKYKNRKDILFVSLAFDNKQDLKTFLKTHRFNYEVVPNQQSYMMDKLNVNTYPTHIIIGKDGKIKKVVDNYKDLLPAFNKEIWNE